MSLWDYRNFLLPWREVGFGGAQGPYDPNSMLQMLTAYDGVTPFVDKKDIVTSPEVTGVNCLSFDGVTNRVDYPWSSTAIRNYTVEGWYKTTSTDGGSNQAFWSGNLYNGTERILPRPNGSVYLEVGDKTGTPLGVFTANEWVYFKLQRVDDVAYFYVGNDPVPKHTITNIVSDTVCARPSFGYQSTANRLTGSLSQVKFSTPDMVGYDVSFPLSEGSGTVAHDVSGNGNHGTITDATWEATGLGSEEILNPDFASASGWYADGGASIDTVAGTGTVYDSGAQSSKLALSNLHEIGKTYQMTYTVIESAGGYLRNNANTPTQETIPSTVGTHTVKYTPTVTYGGLKRGVSGEVTDITVSYVSIKEYRGGYIPSYNLAEGFSPKDLISNGSFDETQDGGWTAQNGATLYDGYVHLDGDSAAIYQDLSITPIVGKTYDIYYEVLRAEGAGNLFLSGNGFTASTPVSSAVGPHKESLPCVDVDPLYFIIQNGTTRDIDITNIRCIDPDCYAPALAEPTLSQLTFGGADYVYLVGAEEDTGYEDNFTIEAWFKYDASATREYIYAATSSDPAPHAHDRCFVAIDGSNNRPIVGHYLGSFVASTTVHANTLVPDKWHHLKWEHKAGDGTQLLWIDGTPQVLTQSSTSTTSATGSRIGMLMNGTFGFHGTIRKVIAGEHEYDFTKYFGKSTEEILIPSGRDGTIVTSSGLSTMWGTRWANRVVGPDTCVVQYAGGQDNIYTGIRANTKTEVVEASIMWNEDAPVDQRMGHTAPYFWFGSSSNGKFQMGYGTSISDTSNVTIQAFKRYEVRLEAHGDTGGKLFVDGELVCETHSVPTLNGSGTYRLFSRSTSNYMNCKLFSFKMWQNGDLVVDATPLAGGVMYDAVTSEVMTSRLDPTTLTTEGLLVEGGTVVDAGSYLPLTNRGGDIYNGAEPLAIQTAADVTHPLHIYVSIDGGGPVQFAYDGMSFGSPQYVSPEGSEWIQKAYGGAWRFAANVATLGTNPATSYLPPTTGWVSVIRQVDLIEYSLNALGGPTYWGTGEVWVPKDYDAALNHPNGSGGSWFKWEQDAVSGVWYVAKADQYPAGMSFTPAQIARNQRYYGPSPIGGFAS